MKTVGAKIVVLGSLAVGKTSLVSRYKSQTFNQNTSSTIGASFTNIELLLGDFKVKMQVWDTAGQEIYRSMAPMFYRGANAALLVFDLTDYHTFEDVKRWVDELRSRVGEDLLLVLIGNKNDLLELRRVEKSAGLQYASSIGATYIETSALDNSGVENVFNLLAEEMVKKIENDANSTLRVYSSSTNRDSGKSKVILDNPPLPQEKKSCCS